MMITSEATVTSPSALPTTAMRTAALEECVKLQLGDFVPWDNPDNLVSADTEALVDRVKSVYVMPVLSVIGIVSNAINMAVFMRQGLKDRIHLCLTALSFADLVYMVVHLTLNVERLRPGMRDERFGPLLTFIVNHRLLGLYGFVWASQFMSAVIATERCFCILCPFRSKTCITRRTITVIIVFAFVLLIGGVFVISFKFSVVCVYDEMSNVTRMSYLASEFYLNHKGPLDWFDFIVYGCLSGLFVLVVMVCTIITTVKLSRIANWRALSSSRTSSRRELVLTRMLIGTSCLFIVCFLPYFVFRLMTFLLKDLSTGQRYHNLFCVLLWCLDMASAFNSSFNFVFYYSMGSLYRQTLREMVERCCWWRREEEQAESQAGKGWHAFDETSV